MLDCVKKGLRDLFRNRLRSFLTIGGIAIGVLSVVVISSIGEIGKYSIDRQMSSMGMEGVVVSITPGGTYGLKESDVETLKEIPDVKNAMPLMNFVTKSTVRDETEACMLWGVNEDANEVIELIPIHGRLLNKGDMVSAAKVCIVDEKIALESYKRSNIVGKKIQVTIGGSQEEFTVVGVVQNGVNLLQNTLGGLVPNFVYVPYTTLQEASSQYHFDQVVVKLRDDQAGDAVSDQIESTLLRSRDTSATVSVENLLKQKNQLNNVLGIITVVLSLIAGISLIVSGLSIMTVMLVSVNERTREIGIKKSIGATHSDIMAEFLIEAMLITLIGAMVGSVLGVSIAGIGCLISGFEFFVNLRMVVGVMGFSMLIGLVFGVYPAHRAAGLNPVEALRFE